MCVPREARKNFTGIFLFTFDIQIYCILQRNLIILHLNCDKMHDVVVLLFRFMTI